MFENLLTNSQKRLLPVLAGTDKELSIFDLSQLAELPYSSTRLALQTLKGANLVASRTLEHKVLFALKRDDKASETILQLFLSDVPKLAFTSATTPSDDDVRWNLATLGAPLVVGDEQRSELSAEETVARALDVARRDPTTARVLPLVLARRLHSLNYPQLRYLAKQAGSGRVLGFFLDLTAALARNARFKKLAEEYSDHRVKYSVPFFLGPSTKYSTMLANRKTPPLARKWHFTMNMDMNDFRSVFEKFRHGDEAV